MCKISFGKVFFELNGNCEHCSMIPGPMYFAVESEFHGTQYCCNCVAANNGITKAAYSKCQKNLAILTKRYEEQMKELKFLELVL